MQPKRKSDDPSNSNGLKRQQFDNGSWSTSNLSKIQKDTERQIRAAKCVNMRIVCSPTRYVKTVQGLSRAHKDAIEKHGFGGMLHMKQISLRRAMLVEIAERFVVAKEVFALGGTEICMTPNDVEQIMGIPIKGEEINLDNITKINGDLFTSYKGQATGENYITIKSLEDGILQSEMPDDHFIRRFVLYTIGLILAPISKDHVDAKYLAFVEQVPDISKKNWGQFTLSNLLSSIRRYKLREQVNLQGNLAFLQYWYWEHVQAYSKHGLSYGAMPHPLMERWDEKNAKLRSDAYEHDDLDGGVVVMTLAASIPPPKTTTPETPRTFQDRWTEPESRPHVQQPSMTNQQLDFVLEALTKNRLATERRVMQMENSICSKILTLEEQLAEQRMEGALRSRLSTIEDGISDIRRDIKDINSTLHSIKVSLLQGHQQYVQEQPCPFRTGRNECNTNFTNSDHEFQGTPDDIKKGFQEFTHQTFGLDSMKTNTSHSHSVKDHETTEKRHISSTQESKVPKQMGEQTQQPAQDEKLKGIMEGVGCMKDVGSKRETSLFASQPRLRNNNSLLYLYSNGNQVNNSIEFIEFKNDYVMSEEDNDVVNFIRNSFESAVVVDIADILLTVNFLQPNVNQGWIYDSVIDAYAHIANVDNSTQSVCSTFQSQKLSGKEGAFDPKRERSWICRLGYRCATRLMVFIPFNVWGCHWCLLVVNKDRKEIQILNSLANVRQLRDEAKETTLVTNIQACIDEAVQGGFLSDVESIDLTQWNKHYYTDIPQQEDTNSCGIYVIKYMLEWNGYRMRSNFTQDQMNIFRKKICTRLLHSEINRRRRSSYKEPLTKQQYLLENPQHQFVGFDDEISIISPQTGMHHSKVHKNPAKNALHTTPATRKDQGQSSQGPKKRGRPRKDGANTMVKNKQVSQESVKSSAPRVRAENQRVSNPSQYQKSPFKQP